MATSNPYVLFPNAIGPDDNRDNSQLSSLCQRRDGDSPSELRLLAEYPGTNGPLCRHLRRCSSTPSSSRTHPRTSRLTTMGPCQDHRVLPSRRHRSRGILDDNGEQSIPSWETSQRCNSHPTNLLI